MRRKQIEAEGWLTLIGFAIGIALFFVPMSPIGGVTYFTCWYFYRRNRLKQERGESDNPPLEPWQIRQNRQSRTTDRSWKLF